MKNATLNPTLNCIRDIADAVREIARESRCFAPGGKPQSALLLAESVDAWVVDALNRPQPERESDLDGGAAGMI